MGLRTAPAPPEERGGPAVTITEPHLARFDREGQRLWELTAEEITVDREADLTLAEGVRLKFFNDEGVALEVTATRLILFNRSGAMELEGEIEAHSDQGLSFRAEQLRWDPQREVLISEGEVEITQGGNRLSGRRLEYSPKEGRLRVEKGRLILLPGE